MKAIMVWLLGVSLLLDMTTPAHVGETSFAPIKNANGAEWKLRLDCGKAGGDDRGHPPDEVLQKVLCSDRTMIVCRSLMTSLSGALQKSSVAIAHLNAACCVHNASDAPQGT